MSLGIAIKATEGIVLAAESRITLEARAGEGRIPVNFDNASKLLPFSAPNRWVGAVSYGLASIGWRSAFSFLPEFEAYLPKERLEIEEFANKLSEFFVKQWNQEMQTDFKGPPMSFVVGGFNKDEPYGRVYLFAIPSSPSPQEKNPDGFGITWGGQREFVDRLIQGYDHRLLDILQKELNLQSNQIDQLVKALEPLQMQMPVTAMPLQDCVNLAIFFIRTTISAQRLTVGIRGCGGPIDVATITRRGGLNFVQQKKIVGETGLIEQGSQK